MKMNDALDLTPPTKAPKAPKAEKAPKAPKEPKAPAAPKVSRFAKLYPREAAVTVLVDKNPKRGASQLRFEGYTGSATVGEALDKGVTYADIAWDVGHGLIKVG
jgi:hypothetical protein